MQKNVRGVNRELVDKLAEGYFCVSTRAVFHYQPQKGFLGGLAVKNTPINARDMGSSPGSGRYPGKEMAIFSSILAWRIPWTEEPGGL